MIFQGETSWVPSPHTWAVGPSYTIISNKALNFRTKNYKPVVHWEFDHGTN
jgi:hypothetical protein